jgi:hypothetical protein
MVAGHGLKVLGSRFWVQRFTVKGLFATGEIKGKDSYGQIFGSSEGFRLDVTLNYEPRTTKLVWT